MGPKVEAAAIGAEAERAKRITKIHDLLTVPLVIGLFTGTCYCYAFMDVKGDQDKQRSAAGVELHPAYRYLTWAAGIYSIYDTIFIVVEPACSKRYWQLLVHHAATCLLVYVALASDSESMTPMATLVELNTIILTTQKLFRLKWLAMPMLITWFSLRLVWYPWVCYYSHSYFLDPRFDESHFWAMQLAAFGVLNGLNVFWTLEFVMPKDGERSMERKDA